MSDFDEKSQRKKEKNKKLIRDTVVVVIVSLILSVLIMLLLNGSETHTSSQSEGVKISSLYCESGAPVDPFFVSPGVINPKHELKVTFRAGELDKISYNFYGTYSDNKTAETASSRLHADYNIHMGQNDVYQEIYYPTFVATGNSVKVNLYADKGTVKPATAKIFFLNSEQYANMNSYSSDDFTKVYADRGFSCIFHE